MAKRSELLEPWAFMEYKRSTFDHLPFTVILGSFSAIACFFKILFSKHYFYKSQPNFIKLLIFFHCPHVVLNMGPVGVKFSK